MYRLPPILTVVLLLTLAVSLRAADSAQGSGAAGEVLLESDLLVSGPQVWVRWTYGSHYHPGSLIVLEGRVVWPGGTPPQGATSIEVREREGPAGPRYRVRFPPGGMGTFRLPVQAPAGLPALRLTLWQGEAELASASLAGHLKVLPAKGRAVLRCGQVSRLPDPPGWQVVPVKPADLPDELWMYDNLDLVILGKGALQGVSDASLIALRRWVKAGGRILIASADPGSKGVLEAAIKAGLAPVPGSAEVVTDPELGHAGVYVPYRWGLGGGLHFLPSAHRESVKRMGMAAINGPILQMRRVARSDTRVWKQPFSFFASDAVPVERRSLSAIWAAVGALCLTAMLFFVRKQRTRYLAAGLAVGIIALLAAFLARTFPQPELTLARFELVDASQDGRARMRTEYTLCEGSWDPTRLVLHAPFGAPMSAQHYNPRELRESPSVLSHEKNLKWAFSCKEKLKAAPLFVCRDMAELDVDDQGPLQLSVPDEQVKLLVPRKAWRNESWGEGTIWLTADGRRMILKREGDAWAAVRLSDELRFLSERFPNVDEKTISAWAKALSFALDDAKLSGRSCLVRCADRLSGEALVLSEGAEAEPGVCFSVLRIEVAEEPVKP